MRAGLPSFFPLVETPQVSLWRIRYLISEKAQQAHVVSH